MHNHAHVHWGCGFQQIRKPAPQWYRHPSNGVMSGAGCDSTMRYTKETHWTKTRTLHSGITLYHTTIHYVFLFPCVLLVHIYIYICIVYIILFISMHAHFSIGLCFMCCISMLLAGLPTVSGSISIWPRIVLHNLWPPGADVIGQPMCLAMGDLLQVYGHIKRENAV